MSQVVSRLQVRRDALAANLRRAAIRDAVLIGSTVYDPEAARDIGIVVTAGAADATRAEDMAEALARVAGTAWT